LRYRRETAEQTNSASHLQAVQPSPGSSGLRLPPHLQLGGHSCQRRATTATR